MTRRTNELPTLTRYLSSFAQYQCRCQDLERAKWISMAVGVNAGSGVHCDVHNQRQALSYVTAAGGFRGGELGEC